MIKRSDQMFSRVGFSREVKLVTAKHRDGAAVAAKKMLAQYAPQHADALLSLATRVVEEQGHLRALKAFCSSSEADRRGRRRRRAGVPSAHEQLVTGYKL